MLPRFPPSVPWQGVWCGFSCVCFGALSCRGEIALVSGLLEVVRFPFLLWAGLDRSKRRHSEKPQACNEVGRLKLSLRGNTNTTPIALISLAIASCQKVVLVSASISSALSTVSGTSTSNSNSVPMPCTSSASVEASLGNLQALSPTS